MSRQLNGIEPMLPLDLMLHEQRGRMEIECVPGWDGK
jgi:hypothetical protein